VRLGYATVTDGVASSQGDRGFQTETGTARIAELMPIATMIPLLQTWQGFRQSLHVMRIILSRPLSSLGEPR